MIKFKIALKDAAGATIQEIAGTTIGRKRILSFATVTASKIELIIVDAKATPLISELAAYHIDEKLLEQ